MQFVSSELSLQNQTHMTQLQDKGGKKPVPKYICYVNFKFLKFYSTMRLDIYVILSF